jgi:hypothetical protein
MIETVVSWDGHAFAPDYEVDFVQGTQPRLPPTQVETLDRLGAWPVIAALQRKKHSLALLFKILDYTDLDDLRSQLFRWFDPEDETPKKLIVTNGASVQQYMYAVCEELRLYQDPRHQEVFVATLAVDGDPRWQAETADSDAWAITASGQTHAVVNGGEDEAYPVYTVRPTSAKAGGFLYRRWTPIKWLSTNAGQEYPLMASLATNALVGAGKMQADGDDLRVLVDGIEVQRWLDAMNSAATKIWFTVNFTGAPTLTLKTAIAGAGDVDSIELLQDISGLPESGILYIGTEAFVYSARNTVDQSVSGVVRAAKGTSAGAHSAADRVHWIQHDVYIAYGNASAVAPSVDDNYKPTFELDHSTNTSWVYEVFGNYAFLDWGDTLVFMGEHRPARWEKNGPNSLSGDGGVYTATQFMSGNPYTVAGAWLGVASGNAFGWVLHNPCGIVNAAWTNGLKRRAGTSFLCHLMYWPRGASWWSWMDTPAAPTNPNAWEAMSYSGAAFSISDTIAIALYFFPSYVEVGDVTVTLNSDETPIVTVNAEQGNYELSCTITNQTTGEAIALQFVMNINSYLEIDTANRTVTWLADDSRQLQSLTKAGTRMTPLSKRHWLRLLPGSNTLRFDEAGVAGLTLTTEFRERYY